MKTFFDRYKLSTAAKAMIRELIDIARIRGHNQESDDEADSGQPSTLSLSDIRAEDVDCVFGLERGKQDDEAWNLDCSEKHDVPEYLFKHPPTYLTCLSQALEDYNLAFGRARQNESLIRVRVNTIMLAALAGQKRDGFYRYQQEKGPDNYLNVNSIRWGVENEITVPWLYKSKRWLIRGAIEHVLWYGSQKRMEGNTVVVVKGLSHPSIGLYEAMSYMGEFLFLNPQPEYLTYCYPSNPEAAPQGGRLPDYNNIWNRHQQLRLAFYSPLSSRYCEFVFPCQRFLDRGLTRADIVQVGILL